MRHPAADRMRLWRSSKRNAVDFHSAIRESLEAENREPWDCGSETARRNDFVDGVGCVVCENAQVQGTATGCCGGALVGERSGRCARQQPVEKGKLTLREPQGERKKFNEIGVGNRSC
jgi:hypothetical protein